MRVLIVAAHPDDEILGVGGTAALHARKGDCVRLVQVCEGISVRYLPERKSEVDHQGQLAAQTLGVTSLTQLANPDQRLDTLPISQIAAQIESIVREHQPEMVYTHFIGDLNRDHRIVAEAVMIACRPYAAPSVREVLMFETPSSTEWGSSLLLPKFEPTVFVGIDDVMELKVEAFSSYTAEVREYPHPRSLEAIRERARYWGSLVNRPAAEPFVLVRGLR
ncbi:MAG: PIG-L family deacetylase [Acidobacteriota bacterium]|nr:PIG-L family deacetylase [Acidobacteriota bacterium]